MTNRIAPLLLLLCASCAPAIEKETMNDYYDDDAIGVPADNRVLYEDDFEDRARGSNKAPAGKVVYPVEPRLGPWSGNPQLGQSQTIVADDTRRQSILKLDEWGMPEIWTITLGIDDNPSVDIVLLEAVINFGSGGATQTITVDWKNGTVLSLPMNSVDVIAEYSTGPTPGDDDLGLTVTLSKGTHATGISPTATSFVSTVASPIPKFATHAAIIRTVAASPDPFVAGAFYDQLSVGGAALATVEGDNLLAYGALGFPLLNGAKELVISGAGVSGARVIYTLGGF